jgi:predicted nucleic acid-binding Zn finger protein
LSAIAAIAEDEKRIIRMFVDTEVNKHGVFGIWVYINGEKKQVLVDNYFPCKSQKPVFSRAKGKELWVMLIEKVWAKIHGSYERIIQG